MSTRADRHAGSATNGEARGAVQARLPLYLPGARHTEVRCDGPSLVVSANNSDAKRYPFARISRVISRSSVEWRASAIAACISEAIPLVFISADGEPVGYLAPTAVRASALDRVLRELFELPMGTLIYRNWQRAERMRALRRWQHRQEEHGREINDAAFKELAREYVYLESDASFRLAGAHVYNAALAAYALEHIVKVGAQPRYWAHEGVSVELASDIGNLLGVVLALELHGLGQRAQGDLAALLRVLHGFGPALREELRCHVGSLHRRMREALETWR